jgi:hypothetical protein
MDRLGTWGAEVLIRLGTPMPISNIQTDAAAAPGTLPCRSIANQPTVEKDRRHDRDDSQG